MDEHMDTLWIFIMSVSQRTGDLLTQVLSPLHVFGPVFVLIFLAVCSVIITKVLNRIIITRRYIELEKNFNHWFMIRQEAMKEPDSVKAKRLARNIDQAKLNRAYYDYFLEGFLLGLIRNVLPIMLMVTYINEYYRAEELNRLFGKACIFSFTISGQSIPVGAVFFYLSALLFIYLAWFVCGRIFIHKTRNASVTTPTTLVENR